MYSVRGFAHGKTTLFKVFFLHDEQEGPLIRQKNVSSGKEIVTNYNSVMQVEAKNWTVAGFDQIFNVF